MNQFSKLKKQKRQMEQMMQLQQAMGALEAEGVSANSLVTVKINGEKELTSIRINPTCIDPSDPEGLQDLILDAMQKAHASLEDKMKGVSPTSGFFGA